MVKALILAAGRGERLRPLTDTHPKPMLMVHGIPMMQWAMRALGSGGFTNLVVNTAWLGQQIEDHFGGQFIDIFGIYSAYLLPNMLSKSEQSQKQHTPILFSTHMKQLILVVPWKLQVV